MVEIRLSRRHGSSSVRKCDFILISLLREGSVAMSTSESPTTSQVVGHQGAQVDITQRRAIAINGWFGVVVLAGCIAGMVVTVGNDTLVFWVLLVAACLIGTALVIVPPGQTSVIQFFG